MSANFDLLRGEFLQKKQNELEESLCLKSEETIIHFIDHFINKQIITKVIILEMASAIS